MRRGGEVCWGPGGRERRGLALAGRQLRSPGRPRIPHFVGAAPTLSWCPSCDQGGRRPWNYLPKEPQGCFQSSIPRLLSALPTGPL